MKKNIGGKLLVWVVFTTCLDTTYTFGSTVSQQTIVTFQKVHAFRIWNVVRGEVEPADKLEHRESILGAPFLKYANSKLFWLKTGGGGGKGINWNFICVCMQNTYNPYK